MVSLGRRNPERYDETIVEHMSHKPEFNSVSHNDSAMTFRLKVLRLFTSLLMVYSSQGQQAMPTPHDPATVVSGANVRLRTCRCFARFFLSSLIGRSSPVTRKKFCEFFTVTIRNANASRLLRGDPAVFDLV